LGQALGAFAFGLIAERIGRVPAARLTIAIYALMSFACAMTSTYEQLFWCRFVQGIGLGGEIPIASTYISEMLRAEKRGGSFLSYQTIFPVGLVMSAITGAYVVPRFGWQWMFILGGTPALIALFLQRFCPESPRWLASRGRLREADTVMSHIEDIVSRNGERPLPEIRRLMFRPTESRTRWRELFEGQYLGRTLLAWLLWACTYLISYGMSGWIPTLFREIYHLPLQQALIYSIAPPLGMLVGSILCASVIDRTGRRAWFIAAYSLTAVGLLLLYLFAARTALGMVLAYAFCAMWTGSMGMAVVLYTAEIYPTRIRAMGVAFASFWLRISATVSPILVGIALPFFGIAGVFGMLASIAVIGGFVALFMVETRHRVLEEVSP
jgi:putative MFS transporter